MSYNRVYGFIDVTTVIPLSLSLTEILTPAPAPAARYVCSGVAVWQYGDLGNAHNTHERNMPVG